MRNILDDSLSVDRERDGVLTEAMKHRIRTLAEYGAATGADAILFICSACGEAIAAASDAMPIPVLKLNEAHVRGGLGDGEALGMLATFRRASPRWRTSFPKWPMPSASALRSKPFACLALCLP